MQIIVHVHDCYTLSEGNVVQQGVILVQILWFC